MWRRVVATIGGLMLMAACGSGEVGHLADPPAEESSRMDGEHALATVREAVAGVPEVAALRRRIEASGGRLVIMLEGADDPVLDRPRVWQVYVGESRPDHLLRRWAFNVDAVSGVLTITDAVTLEDIPFERWRRRLAASPP